MEEEKGVKGLPENAYRVLEPGEEYIPYVPAGKKIPEVTLRSVFIGVLMAVLFTAAASGRYSLLHHWMELKREYRDFCMIKGIMGIKTKLESVTI